MQIFCNFFDTYIYLWGDICAKMGDSTAKRGAMNTGGGRCREWVFGVAIECKYSGEHSCATNKKGRSHAGNDLNLGFCDSYFCRVR